MRKLSSYIVIFTFIFIYLFTLNHSYSTQVQEESPAPLMSWVAAVEYIETTILKDLEALASNKEYGPALVLLDVYRELGSNPNAAVAIGKMLIKKNRDGAVAVIQLTRQELINPLRGPIWSTKQVKRAFVRGIKSTPKQDSKKVLMTTFLEIFTLDGMTVAERTTVEELKKVIDEDLLKTAVILEKVLTVIIEEVGNLSPLDERPEIPAVRKGLSFKEYEELSAQPDQAKEN